MSDTTSIALPSVYRDVSTSGLVAAAESVGFVWLVVDLQVSGESAPSHGRAFVKRKRGAEGEGD
jgi:hypothetical protein